MDNNNYPILPSVADFIPEWPMGGLIDRNCPLCEGSNESLFIRSDGLSVTFCVSCDLWYTSRVPPKVAIVETYKNYYETIMPVKFDNTLADDIKKATTRMIKTRNYDFRLIRLIALTGELQGKRIIDIGCGTGQFLFYLSSLGADVVGCEMSEEACHFIKEHLGIQVFYGGIEEHIGKIGKVDVVLLNDVIEHFIRPLDVLNAVNSILEKNGLIVIWTPNGGNAGRSVETAKKWVGFSIDLEHMQYFSPTSIIRIAKKYNWELVHLESMGYPCIEKLKSLKPSTRKQRFSRVRYKVSGTFGDTMFGRVTKAVFREFVKLPEYKMGTYNLFAILRNSLHDEEKLMII